MNSNYLLAVNLERKYAEKIRTFERTYHVGEGMKEAINQLAKDCKMRLITINALNRILGYKAYDILNPLPDNKQGIIGGPKDYYNHVTKKRESIHS